MMAAADAGDVVSASLYIYMRVQKKMKLHY